MNWSDTDQFIKFLSQLPKNNKILLLCDNSGSHNTELVKKYIDDNLPLVELMLLPPNTTSILQLLDVGVNRTFKVKINELYTKWLLESQIRNSKITDLPKGERLRLLLQWINTSWNCIDHTVVQRSFEFCGYGSNYPEPKWKDYYVE